MNWTGGSLQRTKQANKGVVQKQKAYFARARNHLQNGSSTPAVPFRPDYIQNEDILELNGRPSLYGTGSVRHTGHSTQSRPDRKQRGNLPHPSVLHTDDRRPRSRGVATPELSHGGASVTGHVKHPGAKQVSKRKMDDADIETRLLEANKKRLLSKRDWIGVAPTRPMHLNFMNDNDRNKIGRRRKLRGSHDATARQVQPTGDPYNRAVTSGVSQNQLNEICIRIGADALTTACSTVHNNYNQSQASSDSMLFDQRTHAVEHAPFRDAAQPVARGGTPPFGYTDDLQQKTVRPGVKIMGALVHCCADSKSSLTAEAHREHTLPLDREEQPGYVRSAKPTWIKDIPSSEQTASDFQIMQNVQGIVQPLRLLFAPNSPTTESYASNAVHSIGEGGTNHAHHEVYAGGAPMGDMHQLDNEPERRSESEAAGAISIVDEKPGNSLFSIPDDTSSHGGSSCNSEKSLVHAHAAPQTRECTSWSQHPTHGDQTHISSSLIFASLPSEKRATQTRGPIHGREISKELWNTTLTAMDDSEQLWRDFVFEYEESGFQTTVSEREGKYDWKGSSAYLPLSVAVGATSYTPFRPAPGRVLHMGDEVHDAAMSAPPSGSQAFPSLAATADFVEELSDEELDAMDTAERSAFGEHFVTHTSLLNNASGESPLPLSRIETSPSRLPDQYPHDRECLLVRPDPRRALTRKALDSDDGGIDLIDPDRLF